jgi:PST family polysaccharide transporter
MKKLVTSTAIVGSSSAFGVLAAIVRTKLLAVFVGVAGVGLLAQIGSFLNVLTSLASLGIGVGMVKYVAEFSSASDYAALGKVRWSAALLTWVASAVVAGLACGFSRKLANLLFGAPELGWAVTVTALAVPLSVQMSFHMAIIQGLKQMREYALAAAITSGAGLIVLIPLVYFFRWNGAVLHFLAAAAISYFVVYSFSRNLWRPFSDKARAKADRRLLRELIAYGLSALVTGVLYWTNLLVIRSVIVHRLGANANGVYQVAIGISLQYVSLIVSSVWTYSFPRISELREAGLIVKELRGSVRLSVLLVTGCASTFLIMRHWLIPLLFTKDFLQAENLLAVQFVSDLLKATAVMIGVWLLPQGRLKMWVGLDVILNGVLLGSFFLFLARLDHLGILALLAAPIAHIVAYLLHCILNYTYARKSIGFSFGQPLRRLLTTSFALIVICGVIPSRNLPFSLAGIALIAIWASFSVTRGEAKAVLAILKEKLPRRHKQ